MAEDRDEMTRVTAPLNTAPSSGNSPVFPQDELSGNELSRDSRQPSPETAMEYDGQISDKLIAAKADWARNGRGLTGQTADPAQDRLPPGQRLVDDLPVLDLGVTPRLSVDNWSLVIDGLVEQPMRWNWDDLNALPVTEITSDLHCVTTWSRYDNRWRGVSTRDLLARVKPRPEARFVLCHGFDGYTTNLPLAMFAADNALLATHWQDEPLALDHGGPVRIVVPRLYLWKSSKWVQRIEFLAEDQPGYWETRGYHNDADPWREERYSE